MKFKKYKVDVGDLVCYRINNHEEYDFGVGVVMKINKHEYCAHIYWTGWKSVWCHGIHLIEKVK